MSMDTRQTFKAHLLQVTLPWRGAGLDDLQRSLPTTSILWFCDKNRRNVLKVNDGCSVSSDSSKRSCLQAVYKDGHFQVSDVPVIWGLSLDRRHIVPSYSFSSLLSVSWASGLSTLPFLLLLVSLLIFSQALQALATFTS